MFKFSDGTIQTASWRIPKQIVYTDCEIEKIPGVLNKYLEKENKGRIAEIVKIEEIEGSCLV